MIGFVDALRPGFLFQNFSHVGRFPEAGTGRLG